MRKLRQMIYTLDSYTASQLMRRPTRGLRLLAAARAANRIAGGTLRQAQNLDLPDPPPSVAVGADIVVVHGFEASICPGPTWDAGPTKLARFHLHYMDWLGSLPEAVAVRVIGEWQERYQVGDAVAWAPYVVSSRILALVKLRARLVSGGMDSANLAEMVGKHAAFLSRCVEWDVGGNHLLRNGCALFLSGHLLDSGLAPRLREQGRHIIDTCLETQILSDGGHIERSAWYHSLTASDLLDALRVGPPSPRWLAHLRRMLDWLHHLRGAGGRLPLFGDSCEQAGRLVERLFRRAALWGMWSPPESRESVTLQDTGWHRSDVAGVTFAANLRLTGDRKLRGHTHGDLGSFELWNSDGPIVVDPGTFSYTTASDRQRARSTAAHNALTIDGLNQLQTWGAFRAGPWLEPSRIETMSDGPDRHVEVEHAAYRALPGHPIHVRSFTSQPGGLSIKDTVRPGSMASRERRKHNIVRLLRFPGEVHVETFGQELLVGRHDLEIRFRADTDWELTDSEWWPSWGIARPAVEASLRVSQGLPWRGAIEIEI